MSRLPSGWVDNTSISWQKSVILLRRSAQWPLSGRTTQFGKARAFHVPRSPFRVPAHSFDLKARRSIFDSMAIEELRRQRLCKWLRCCSCIVHWYCNMSVGTSMIKMRHTQVRARGSCQDKGHSLRQRSAIAINNVCFCPRR